MKNPMQEYYDQELNFEITTFWDEGFTIRFGDPVNGYSKPIFCDTWEEVEKAFKKKLAGNQTI